MSSRMSLCRCRSLLNVLSQDRRIVLRLNAFPVQDNQRKYIHSAADLKNKEAVGSSKKKTLDSLDIRLTSKAAGTSLNKKIDKKLIKKKEDVKTFKKSEDDTIFKKNKDDSKGSDAKEELFAQLRAAAPATNSLSGTVTKSLEDEILAGSTQQRFILRQAVAEIRRIENRRHHLFTLPQSLTLEEWRTLISLADTRSRLVYLQQLASGDTDLEAIKAQDTLYQNPLQISEEMIAETVGDDKEGRRRIKIFAMHHEMARQEGERVPFNITEKDLIEIAQISSTAGFKKYLAFMLKNEMRSFNVGLKKSDKTSRLDEIKATAREAKEAAGSVGYGLGVNTIHLRFYKTTFNHSYDWNAVREFNSWGTPLIINMGHHNSYKLKRPAMKSLAAEIKNSIIVNKTSQTPFQLHITDVDDSSRGLIESYYDTGLRPESPCNITRESHLDMFARDRLVYLSPDSNVDLKVFNSDDVYVIGGIIDKTDEKQPITLSAAKRNRLRHARFPMRQNLGLTAELNIETCVAIMTDLKATQDWFFSLRWVPSRFLGHRCKTSSNLQHYLAYRAHRFLSPTGPSEVENYKNLSLTPSQYRFYYRKIMEARTEEDVDEVIKDLRK